MSVSGGCGLAVPDPQAPASGQKVGAESRARQQFGRGRLPYGAGLFTRIAGRRPAGPSKPVGRNAPAAGQAASRIRTDALLAARTTLTAGHHAQPRSDADREALRMLLVAHDHANAARTAAIKVFKGTAAGRTRPAAGAVTAYLPPWLIASGHPLTTLASLGRPASRRATGILRYRFARHGASDPTLLLGDDPDVRPGMMGR